MNNDITKEVAYKEANGYISNEIETAAYFEKLAKLKSEQDKQQHYIHGQVFPQLLDKKETTRTSVLNEANAIVNGARNQAYGSAEDNFKNIADLWAAYKNVPITAVDVANMMMLMKIARLKHAPSHRDSWVDVAGYAACGAAIGLK